jgi:hypothetical protein
VSAYVAGLPHRFDRQAAVQALVGAVNNKQALSYTLNTKHVTTVTGAGAATPAVKTYRYCVNPAESSDFRNLVTAALAAPQGWALGGRLAFTEAGSGCNFTVTRLGQTAMSALGPACQGQATCLVGGTLAVSEQALQGAPATWKGDAASYQTQLINHVVGHWLGFEHASCTAKSAAPVLSTPTVTLGGCSPNWYGVPAELQDRTTWNTL